MTLFSKTIILSLPFLFFFVPQKKEPEEYVINGLTQGTTYTIKYVAKSHLITKKIVDSLLLQIDHSMSLYMPESLITKFNTSDSGCSLDPMFAAVMRESFKIYEATDGKFDVTVAPLVQAWGFGVKPVDSFPDSVEVKQILKNVGMNKLQLKGNFLKKLTPEVRVDLNGIAQGYSVDYIANYLLKKGIKSFMVEIGGELRIQGLKPDGTARRIGIEGPALTPGAAPELRHVISVTKGAVTTSGNYRKWLQKGATRVTHLIDPLTGYPLSNPMISATIFAKDAMTADGYDNALMAMEVEEALRFVDAKKGMEAYLIYHRKDGSVADTLTSGFRKMIVN